MRVIGSPDPYGKQIDGMGGATSSTSKTVILSKSARPDHDVDYLFGQVVDRQAPSSTGAATAATCRRRSGRSRSPTAWSMPAACRATASATVRIWQANIGKTDHRARADRPMAQVQETGDFELDGVTFPAAEVQLEFMDPADEGEGGGGAMFPTGKLVDDLDVPGVGTFKATMINAGIPTIFVNADAIGYTGTELQDAINGDAEGAGHVRDDPRTRRGAHGPDQARRRSREAPAHAEDRLRRAAARLRRRPAASRSRPATSTCWCARCRWASCTTR